MLTNPLLPTALALTAPIAASPDPVAKALAFCTEAALEGARAECVVKDKTAKLNTRPTDQP
jgi:hypothetical protein